MKVGMKMKIEEIIAIGIVLPLLLSVVLGIAYYARKAKNVHVNILMRNITLIKDILGFEMEYVEKGKLPFHIVGEDPSLHAKYANSCICSDMLQGNYKGIDYTVTNMVTTHSKGYSIGTDETSYSIFSGFYIFFNVHVSKIKPLYACSNDFWKDFNVKKSLHFKVRNKDIYESNNPFYFNLLLDNVSWNSNSDQSKLYMVLESFFQETQQPVSIFIYTDGQIGIAVRDYKLFNFNQGYLPQLNNSASESTHVREIIQNDVKMIKNYLDQLHVLIKHFI